MTKKQTDLLVAALFKADPSSRRQVGASSALTILQELAKIDKDGVCADIDSTTVKDVLLGLVEQGAVKSLEIEDHGDGIAIVLYQLFDPAKARKDYVDRLTGCGLKRFEAFLTPEQIEVVKAWHRLNLETCDALQARNDQRFYALVQEANPAAYAADPEGWMAKHKVEKRGWKRVRWGKK